jgi:tetratricopeptide (TPR) repeat protein
LDVKLRVGRRGPTRRRSSTGAASAPAAAPAPWPSAATPHARGTSGEYQQAASDYGEAIRAEPEDAWGYYGRGLAYSAHGDHDLAIADFTEAVRLDKRFMEAFLDRGMAYVGKGQLAQAVADFSKAIKLNRVNPLGYYRRSLAYQKLGEQAQAEEDAREAARLDPNVSTARVESMLVPQGGAGERAAKPRRPRKEAASEPPAGHYVCYHNAEGQGFSIGCTDKDDEADEVFNIGTSKPVDRLMGKTVWLVTGEGKPRRYFLTHRFVVDEAGPSDGGGYFARGRQGTAFRPRVELNELPWFKGFLKSQSNFSLGLQPIKAEHLAEFQRLAGVSAPGPGRTGQPEGPR